MASKRKSRERKKLTRDSVKMMVKDGDKSVRRRMHHLKVGDEGTFHLPDGTTRTFKISQIIKRDPSGR